MFESDEKGGFTFTCPECRAPLQKREGKMGPFWGCSEYPKCRSTLNDINGRPSKEVDELYRCPLCTRRLVRAAPEKGNYWFCSGYSKGCKATVADVDGRPEAAFKCPKCGSMLAKRASKSGEFWGCSSYPDCKATFNDLNDGPDFDFLPAKRT
ncbi:MAG TPA: DNA topoisomerase I [Gammaproteobacteria bacterium]|nr:DNA topoisomerase I [Gammaproteobacteria bacterium]